METSDSRVRPFVLLRVLVADSDRLVNESLNALLSEIEGLSVFGCTQEPSRVLMLIQTVHPDVVILALQIKGPFGMKLVRQIKDLPDAPTVIVLSDYDEAQLRRVAIAAGAEHCIVKTDIERLQEVLGDLLRQGATSRGQPIAPPASEQGIQTAKCRRNATPRRSGRKKS